MGGEAVLWRPLSRVAQRTHVPSHRATSNTASTTSSARPVEFLDDLAWALLYPGNERHGLGYLEGAVAADERAVARVRTLAGLGRTGASRAAARRASESRLAGHMLVRSTLGTELR